MLETQMRRWRGIPLWGHGRGVKVSAWKHEWRSGSHSHFSAATDAFEDEMAAACVELAYAAEETDARDAEAAAAAVDEA